MAEISVINWDSYSYCAAVGTDTKTGVMAGTRAFVVPKSCTLDYLCFTLSHSPISQWHASHAQVSGFSSSCLSGSCCQTSPQSSHCSDSSHGTTASLCIAPALHAPASIICATQSQSPSTQLWLAFCSNLFIRANVADPDPVSVILGSWITPWVAWWLRGGWCADVLDLE